mmetsp:Transcript_9290/g.12474  ORF Transcript_9290/g.12474 Transcript_9290/m.12474 type:complete len:89 (-) Transcript_9290:2197-2463(-)|eukprot:1286527-Ditylum_brightwellii.AAC.1
MGCFQSKPSYKNSYQARKANGFKDPGLEQHRKDCVKQKKKLKHVEDPAKKRKEKIAHIQQENKKHAKAGPAGVNQNDLAKARNNLKHR